MHDHDNILAMALLKQDTKFCPK